MSGDAEGKLDLALFSQSIQGGGFVDVLQFLQTLDAVGLLLSCSSLHREVATPEGILLPNADQRLLGLAGDSLLLSKVNLAAIVSGRFDLGFQHQVNWADHAETPAVQQALARLRSSKHVALRDLSFSTSLALPLTRALLCASARTLRSLSLANLRYLNVRATNPWPQCSYPFAHSPAPAPPALPGQQSTEGDPSAWVFALAEELAGLTALQTVSVLDCAQLTDTAALCLADCLRTGADRQSNSAATPSSGKGPQPSLGSVTLSGLQLSDRGLQLFCEALFSDDAANQQQQPAMPRRSECRTLNLDCNLLAFEFTPLAPTDLQQARQAVAAQRQARAAVAAPSAASSSGPVPPPASTNSASGRSVSPAAQTAAQQPPAGGAAAAPRPEHTQPRTRPQARAAAPNGRGARVGAASGGQDAESRGGRGGGGEVGSQGTAMADPTVPAALCLPTSLRQLHLRRNKIGPMGAEHLTAALTRSGCALSELLLRLNGLGNGGAASIASYLSSPSGRQLSKLDISCNQIGCTGIAAVCKVLSCEEPGATAPSLHTLFLGSNKPIERSAYAVAAMLKTNPNMRVLFLDNMPLMMSQRGLAAIGQAVGESALECISLSKNKITDKGLADIAQSLGAAPRLSKLLLRSNALTHDAARTLAWHVLRSPSLRELHLFDNQLGDAGAVLLFEQLAANARDAAACRLATLDLSANGITDGGLVGCVEALKPSSGNANGGGGAAASEDAQGAKEQQIRAGVSLPLRTLLLEGNCLLGTRALEATKRLLDLSADQQSGLLACLARVSIKDNGCCFRLQQCGDEKEDADCRPKGAAAVGIKQDREPEVSSQLVCVPMYAQKLRW